MKNRCTASLLHSTVTILMVVVVVVVRTYNVGMNDKTDRLSLGLYKEIMYSQTNADQ